MSIIHKLEGGGVAFFCPGCKCAHSVPVVGSNAWGWNGSLDKPTLTPSILVSYDGNPPADRPNICHSNVTDGHIMFHSDSTHALAGKTVPLMEFSVE